MPKHSMLDKATQTRQDEKYYRDISRYFDKSIGDTLDKLRNFGKYVPRQALATFLVKNEIFKRMAGIHGHIVECGVFAGGGLLTWAQLSAIYEPYAHVRRIVGFDTFEGFPQLSDKDGKPALDYAKPGGLATGAQADIARAIELYDLNRPIGHIPRVEVIAGDAVETIPRYVAENQHLIVAMLYLDFDLYEPTKVALEQFYPRMPKGAVIAFDELAQANWPGETRALLDTIGVRSLKIERMPFNPQISFAVLD
jgi:hypothetical protein